VFVERALSTSRRRSFVRECGLAIELFEDPPFERAPPTVLAAHRDRGSKTLVAEIAAALPPAGTLAHEA
jgi:hypothetical protein